jgi:hypothetical protein
MAMPVEKVELGFDDNAKGNWFVLDDPVKGQLDNTTYTLSGAAYYDVTQYLTSIAVSRGKNRELDRFNAGHVVATFNNKNRYFDPTYTSSPFYGQVVPRRDIRVSANGTVVFVGITDDWNLDYSPDGNSVASVSGYDALSWLSQQTLTAGTATAQLSGARVNAVLSDPGVNWATDKRNIDAGQETLQADVITGNQNALSYVNIIEQSEPGIFFVDKNGYMTYKDRLSVSPASNATILADDGSGIPYSAVKVTYGSELLFNQAELTRAGSSTVITANDTTSQASYGIRTINETNLLQNSDANLQNLANYLVKVYAQPEFRFEAVEVVLSKVSTANQNAILGLEIGSICKIVFTPNGIAPSISKYAEVIGINHSVSLTDHRVTLGFQTLDVSFFVLDDPVFGLLDSNVLAY